MQIEFTIYSHYPLKNRRVGFFYISVEYITFADELTELDS